MSTVHKLQIQGIRSFDPESKRGSSNMIQFFTPMTLIVGQNGCGKTTIIESLKYAITNEYPPGTSKGQTFINDPKLSGGYEVMARVALEVVGGSGDKYSIVKRLKATSKGKAGNISVSTIEGTVSLTKKDGTKHQLSSKCSDLKAETCRLMGVSEPIINNVLLCHQEDSCWPLDEGKKVKEKFDAIFNTTMYIKCLDQLLKKEKEIAQQIKLEELGLRHAAEIMKAAAKKQRDLTDKNAKLQVCNTNAAEYASQLAELETKYKSLEDLEREYTKIAGGVQEKKGNIDSINLQMEELREGIKEQFSENIETLRDMISNFKLESSKNQQSLKMKEKECTKINAEVDRLSKLKNTFLVKKGQFQQEESANEKRLLASKDQTMKVIAMIKKLKENSQDVTFSGAMEMLVNVDTHDDSVKLDPQSAIKALAGAIHMKETEYKKVQGDFEIEEKKLQETVDELRASKVSLETEIDMKKTQIRDNTTSVTSLRKRLMDIEGCNERLALLDDEESTFAVKIADIENSGIIDKCEKETKELSAEIKSSENKIANLNVEIKLLTEDKSKLDQIAIFNRQKQEKQNASKNILQKREDELESVLGEIPTENIGRALEDKLKVLKNEINTAERELKVKEKKCATYESELKQVENALVKKEKQLNDIKLQQSDVLEGKEWSEVYEEVTTQKDELKKEVFYAEAAQFLYLKNIQRLQSKNCCPLCRRNMDSKEQLSKLISELNRDVEKMKNSQPQSEKAIEQLEEKHDVLMKLKPNWDIMKALEGTELPDLKKKKAELEPLVKEMKEEIEGLNDTLTLLKNDHATGSNCTKDVALYEQNLKEVKKQDDSILNVEKSRNPKAKSITKNLTEVQNSLKDLEGTLKAKKIEKENKEDLRNQKREELSSFQQQKNKVQAEKLTITQEMQNREALEKQKKELEEKTKQLQECITENNRKLPSIKNEIKDAENNKNSVTKEKEEKLKSISSEKDSLANQKKELTKISHEILEFEKAKLKFREVQDKAEECNNELNDCETKKKEILDKIDSLKDEISSRDTKLRNLTDNLSLKEKGLQLEKLKSEMAAQEKLLAETNSRGVSVEKREYSKKQHALNSKLNVLIGSRTEVQKAIADLRKELGERPYVTAEDDYKTKLITKVVYEKTKKDIARYRATLDHAILTFHSKRMEHINRLLRELWRTIYKGNDIDYIQIKTENSNTDGPSNVIEVGKSTRKTYQYRVVQIRRGIEMDLRGRCSAGQKVLASLIIRIALADSFSSKCGIMTLDEPTTNLDQKNINSLAETLSKLAVKLSRMKTFQLIIITHDQDFIERLLSVDPVDNYYRVTRDERGFSQIRSVSKHQKAVGES